MQGLHARRPNEPGEADPALVALYPFYFEHIVPNGRRALVYRDDHGREVQEIEIVLDDGRVATVQRRVRRTPRL